MRYLYNFHITQGLNYIQKNVALPRGKFDRVLLFKQENWEGLKDHKTLGMGVLIHYQ